MPIRPYLLATTALSSFGALWVITPADASDVPGHRLVQTTAVPVVREPAVSGINFAVEGFGGWKDGKTPYANYGSDIWGGAGKLSVPLGSQFGLQVDGIAGSWGGDGFWGIGGHLFWRDPALGLVGVYVNHMAVDRGGWQWLGRGSGLQATKVMLETEYYWTPSVTLRAALGGEFGDIDSRFTSKADVLWYPMPDLKLGIGHRYTGGLHALALSTEYLTPWSLGGPGNRVALFAEGRIGEEDYRGVWAGVRFYFGKSQTLVDKNRKDDPFDWLPDNLFTIQQLVNQLDIRNAANQPPPPGPYPR